MSTPTIIIGDMFQLGTHRLLVGDAKDPKAVARLLGENRVSLILSDPPYGVAYVEGKENFRGQKNTHRAIQNDHEQTEEEYRVFTKKWMEAIHPFLAEKNACYIFNSDRMILALREGMRDAGYRFAQLLIWAKTHSVIGRMDYHMQHEVIAYGWSGTHEFMKTKDRSLLLYPKPTRSLLHPTMKPVGLLRRLLLNSSRINDWIYDPFGGSGSTLIAAEDTKRRCAMIEIDPEYCRVIIDRFEKLSGIKAVFISHAHNG
jgi:DNA modification methylase